MQLGGVLSQSELACMSSCLAHDPVGNVGSNCVSQSYPATSCQVEEYTSALPEAVHQFSFRLPPEIGGSLDAQLPQLRIHLVAGPRSTLHHLNMECAANLYMSSTSRPTTSH